MMQSGFGPAFLGGAFYLLHCCKNKLVGKFATLKNLSLLSIMKVKQSISFEQINLEQARELADKEQTSLSFIVNRALFSYLNQSPTIQRNEKSTPSQRIIAVKTTTNNGVVRRRAKPY